MLDVAAPAPGVASAKRGRACAVSVGHGVLDNAAETGVHFEAVDLIAESLYLVGLYQSASGFALGVDCGCNVASLTVNLCAEVSSCETIVAAIMLSQRLFILCFLRFPVRSDYIFTLLIGVGYSCRDYWYLSSPVSR